MFALPRVCNCLWLRTLVFGVPVVLGFQVLCSWLRLLIEKLQIFFLDFEFLLVVLSLLLN